MTRKFLCASAFVLLMSSAALSAETVTFTMKADQQSLRDKTLFDTFTVGLADKQVETNLTIKCQAATGGIIGGQNESCAVTGNGVLVNPANGQKIQRTQIAGGWVEKSDGYTDATTLKTNYLAVGKVAASEGAFSGSMMLKPKVPSTTASLLRDSIMKNLKSKQSGLIDERVDTVQLVNFTVPSIGLPSDKGCVWNGDMVYAYQTSSWFINVKAKCNGKEYQLKGNMPFTATPNVGNQHQYDLTLALPSADVGTDDALFAAPSGDADAFAAADGISGQIIMKESQYVDVESDGQTDKVAVNIDGTGSFVGQNVSLDAVRSFSLIVGILSRTFFGA
ncbi:MAG: hypothetical protein ABIN69_07955 [Aestuariivirga sp.]